MSPGWDRIVRTGIPRVLAEEREGAVR
jgi:hypothetical protein